MWAGEMLLMISAGSDYSARHTPQDDKSKSGGFSKKLSDAQAAMLQRC